MKPLALSSIRLQNLSKVLDLLTLSPAMTRLDLADATALSQMTVTNLVELLKKQGVLRLTSVPRDEASRHTLGRKAEAISLCGDRNAWLEVNISSRQFSMKLLGFDLALLLEIHDDHQGEYLPRLESFLQESRPKVLTALGDRELLGVAIVTPGPYEISSDTVSNQRLPELNGVQIKELFRRCLGPYEYYVDEDVKFAVRAFSDLTAQNHCEVLYYLFIGEGVGGAAVHGGNMLRGLNATAGDAGQLTGDASSTFESRLSTETFLGKLGITEPVSAEKLPSLLEAIAAEHPQRFNAALDEMAAVTAEMLHSVLWLLDPTHIIIDCIYARPAGDAFVQATERHLRRLFQAENRLLPQILPCQPGVSSVLRGAVSVLQRAWLERLLT